MRLPATLSRRSHTCSQIQKPRSRRPRKQTASPARQGRWPTRMCPRRAPARMASNPRLTAPSMAQFSAGSSLPPTLNRRGATAQAKGGRPLQPLDRTAGSDREVLAASALGHVAGCAEPFNPPHRLSRRSSVHDHVSLWSYQNGGFKESAQHYAMTLRLEEVALVSRPRWHRLPPELRREVMRLAERGLSYTQIQSRLDLSLGTLSRVLQPLGGVIRKDMLTSTGRRLSLAERVEIRVGLERGWSYRQIGAQLGRAASTICREVAAGGGRAGYQPVASQQRAIAAARRPKPAKLACNPRLCAEVTARLEQLWSPQQIACYLRERGDARLGTVSHETIYKSLYVQGRGELRRELSRCLRTGRAAAPRPVRPQRQVRRHGDDQ